MQRVLLVDNSARDAKRLGELLAKESIELEFCSSGTQAEKLLSSKDESFSAAIVLWELPGTLTGSDVLIKSLKLRPEMPVVVTSELLDFSLARRAHGFGAKRFLLKPFDSQEFLDCMRSLLSADDPLSPLVERLREEILGESPEIIATLKQLAKVIPHRNTRVLLIGETGTGKELFARAIHKFGPRFEKPWVPVDLNTIAPTLVESALFGHEKGSFTGAAAQREGYFEEAGDGLLFLDEIGKLDLSIQNKLLRVIQERKFRRVGGRSDLEFRAGLVCATSTDLALAVNEGRFARDLFHRIAEVTIHLPPLRERKGDVDLLINHFLDGYRHDYDDNRQLKFSPGALAILRSYPLKGNIRELRNLVYACCINCEGTQITDLPVGDLSKLEAEKTLQAFEPVRSPAVSDVTRDDLVQELLSELPAKWSTLSYRDAADHFNRAFDRVYLKKKLDEAHHNISKAARDAGIDAKTLRKRWKDSGLPPLSDPEVSDAD
jgi:DNA-binding NtrC family response regulator